MLVTHMMCFVSVYVVELVLADACERVSFLQPQTPLSLLFPSLNFLT